ncbi:MAG: PEP/pyruvate-binding domain-containing protein, partial [Cyanobacteria bacterium P01_H01_bin.15]
MVVRVIDSPTLSTRQTALVLWFEAVGLSDVALVGGKNASLGEMIQQLSPKGVQVPSGFATTAYAYRYFLEQDDLKRKLQALFADLDADNLQNLRSRGKKARALILNTPFPPDLQSAIADAYFALCHRYGSCPQIPTSQNTEQFAESQSLDCDTDVAVRSSATAEDLPDASFAGQQETYLNVHGVKNVLSACHKCFASLFTDRAISYRASRGFDHLEVALSVGVQKMVRADLAASGVMFSIDPETGFSNAVLITAAYGLGENVVQGAVNPDEFFVFKPTLKPGFHPILEKRLGSKHIRLVYDLGGSKLTKNTPVPEAERQKFAIADAEILTLARWATVIEEHYSTLRQTPTPMDIGWA